jgi:hypothetical protein
VLRRLIVILPLILAGAAHAGEVTDSTGRVVRVPDRIARVLPAGPRATLLPEAIAPDLMVGWPGPSRPMRWRYCPPTPPGLTWLSGHEPTEIAASFYAVVYGHVLTPSQIDAVLGGVQCIQPREASRCVYCAFWQSC